jgi:hypothetical protein
MSLPNDDILRGGVDTRFLGPKGYTLPFAARYSAWTVGFFVMVLCLALERRVGIGFNPYSAVWALMITVTLTTVIHRHVDVERPVRALATTFWHEVDAPRTPPRVEVVIRVPRLRP